MRDKVVIYDDTFTPAAGNVIAANTLNDLATVDAGEHGFVIEEMHLYSPYNFGGLPAGLDRVQILIDGEPFPATPSRLHIRGMAERSMANPYDQRFAKGPFPFGEISLDPLEDTTIKVTPAQRIAVRLWADATGILATDSVIRVMLLGRVADTDAQLQNIYGGIMYQPGGPTRIGDPVTGKISPTISKSFPITIDNMKRMSGATGQQAPKINPFWTWGVNSGVIPDVPEYEWTYVNPAHVARPWEEFSFDWTRISDRALHIKNIAAYLAAGRGRVWWDQSPLRRPGHLNMFFGWVINAGFPMMIPGGGAPGLTGMFQGPFDLDPKVLAYNNMTELRVAADPGTTILAGNLEMQMRGTLIEY